MFSEIMRYILDLGPTVMLPIVIIIFSKILGMKLGDCFKSGLHIGIGFVGIGLVIGLMLDSIGPAAKAMAEHRLLRPTFSLSGLLLRMIKPGLQHRQPLFDGERGRICAISRKKGAANRCANQRDTHINPYFFRGM